MRESRSTLRPISSHAVSRTASAEGVELHLLNSFGVVRDGLSVEIPIGAQRLVAFVTLLGRPVRREYVAGTLWPDTSDERAAANLRSTLWRIQSQVRGLIVASDGCLRLGPEVWVDLRLAEELTHRVLEQTSLADDPGELALLAADLLPDWYDEWLLFERERFRQLRLSALEQLCDRRAAAGRLGEALELGLLSVAGEPLRESGHRALIRVHLAAGNAVEALRQYGVYRRLLHEQLGIEPTLQLRELIDAVGLAL